MLQRVLSNQVRLHYDRDEAAALIPALMQSDADRP